MLGVHGGDGQGRIYTEIWRAAKPTLYKILQTNPTTKFKNKLISILKSIKSEGGIDENTYKRLYPTGATPPKY